MSLCAHCLSCLTKLALTWGRQREPRPTSFSQHQLDAQRGLHCWHIGECVERRIFFSVWIANAAELQVFIWAPAYVEVGGRVAPGRASCGSVAGMSPGDGSADAGMMRDALNEAERCLEWDDVPIGAVLTRGSEVLARAGNERERRNDPTAHAEVLALRAGAQRAGSWRLDGATLYVTLEPCAMCAGALVLARVHRLVFGAADPKAGFAGSLGDLVRDPRLNHRVEVVSGVLAEECGELLRRFFQERRATGGC